MQPHSANDMRFIGEMAERSNAAVLKTALRETVTGVRIPEPPQKHKSGEN